MQSEVQLQLVHRNRLFRQCLEFALGELGWRVNDVNDVEWDESNCLQQIVHGRCDVLLVDLNFAQPSSRQLIARVREQRPRVKILVLVPATVQESPRCRETLAACIAAGAHGCILEEANLQQLQVAICKVLEGEKFYCTEIVHSIFTQVAQSVQQPAWLQRAEIGKLTAREREVLQLVANHLSNKQIAKRLSVSLYTVKNHVHSILEKLQVGSRLEAADLCGSPAFSAFDSHDSSPTRRPPPTLTT